MTNHHEFVCVIAETYGCEWGEDILCDFAAT